MAAMIPPLIQVALGGAAGAALRYVVGAQLARPGFPVAVLTANVVGSFAMGVLAVMLARAGLRAWEPLLLTGLLGGFTTFSAFSQETVTMVERGAFGHAALYVLLSVGLSIAALAVGAASARVVA